MLVKNRCSRYLLVIQAAQKIAMRNSSNAALTEALIMRYEGRLAEHRRFIDEHGMDSPDITDWK